MKKSLLTIAALVNFSGAAFAENEVTVDPTTLRLTIPTVIYQGGSYSAKLSFNGACFVVDELLQKSSQVALTHDGFDFSAGATAANWDVTDGTISVWTTKDYPAGYAYGGGLWWSPYNQYDQGNNDAPIKDMGEVTLSSVTTVPTDWTYVSSTGVYPLMVNHVYVVKARDGYGKFKVISLSGLEFAVDANWDPTKWQAVVEYGYTTGTSF